MNLFLEKYTIHVKDTGSKKPFKMTIDENHPQDAHQKAYNKLNNHQEIVKIMDYTGNTVFTSDVGFVN
jgi:hypothetical protein